MDTKILSITVMMAVTVKVDARLGDDGAEVVGVRDVELPSAGDVMEALDAGKQFDELDALFDSA